LQPSSSNGRAEILVVGLGKGYEVRVPRQYAKPETSRETPWPGKLKAVTASRGHLIQIIMHVKNALSSGHWFAASKPGYQLGRSMTAAARKSRHYVTQRRCPPFFKMVMRDALE
jgi:hypothetical protein